MLIRRSITLFGARNLRRWIYRSECSEKISRPRDYSRTPFTSGTDFESGKAELMVTEPRMPCYKLGIKFGRADIIKRFLASRRSGFYFAVTREGMVSAGDALELIGREQQDISVADITRLYAFEKDDLKALRRAIEVGALPENWKGYFRHQIEKQAGR